LCLDWDGHGVAEDIGRGWKELKVAHRANRPTDEQKENMMWFERQASHNHPKGIGNGRIRFWDKEKINRELAR
jgi:hypothetical protein